MRPTRSAIARPPRTGATAVWLVAAACGLTDDERAIDDRDYGPPRADLGALIRPDAPPAADGAARDGETGDGAPAGCTVTPGTPVPVASAVGGAALDAPALTMDADGNLLAVWIQEGRLKTAGESGGRFENTPDATCEAPGAPALATLAGTTLLAVVCGPRVTLFQRAGNGWTETFWDDEGTKPALAVAPDGASGALAWIDDGEVFAGEVVFDDEEAYVEPVAASDATHVATAVAIAHDGDSLLVAYEHESSVTITRGDGKDDLAVLASVPGTSPALVANADAAWLAVASAASIPIWLVDAAPQQLQSLATDEAIGAESVRFGLVASDDGALTMHLAWTQPNGDEHQVWYGQWINNVDPIWAGIESTAGATVALAPAGNTAHLLYLDTAGALTYQPLSCE